MAYKKSKPSVGCKVMTYLDDGRVFVYNVDNEHKAREHSVAIIRGGYRHNDGNGEFEHYGPHRIIKVKVIGADVSTKYPDETLGT